jgi:hypothetical protein
MALRQKLLGPNHRDTLISMASLASTYEDLGQYEKAAELDLSIMEQRQKTLGAEHPATLSSMHNLAITWKSQGRDAEAIELMASCLQLKTKVYGADDSSTRKTAEWLDDWKTSETDRDTLQNSD